MAALAQMDQPTQLIRVNMHKQHGTAVYHSATVRIYVHFKKAHTVVFAYCAFMYSSVGSIDITDILPLTIFKAVEKEITEWLADRSKQAGRS